MSRGRCQSLERGKVLLGLAAQPALLNAEIGELAVVSQIDLGLDQLLADAFLLVREQLGEFQPAEGIDACLKRGNAGQAPMGVGEGLD